MNGKKWLEMRMELAFRTSKAFLFSTCVQITLFHFWNGWEDKSDSWRLNTKRFLWWLGPVRACRKRSDIRILQCNYIRLASCFSLFLQLLITLKNENFLANLLFRKVEGLNIHSTIFHYLWRFSNCIWTFWYTCVNDYIIVLYFVFFLFRCKFDNFGLSEF